MQTRILKVSVNEDGEINIHNDGVLKAIIKNEDKISVKGEDILNALDYMVGDKYEVDENGGQEPSPKYKECYESFVDLIKELVREINKCELGDDKTRDITLEDK